MSLQLEINELNANLKSQLPAEALELVGAAMEELIATGIENEALGMGAQAPDFSLANATGQAVSLGTARQQGPVILKFYRGNW